MGKIEIEKRDMEQWISFAYGTAGAHGFHDTVYSNEHWLMLILGEIAEAVEADRNGKTADLYEMIAIHNYTFCNKRPDKKTVKEDFEKYIKDKREDELADICIRIFDFIGMKGWGGQFWAAAQGRGPVPEDKTFTEFCYGLCECLCLPSPPVSLRLAIVFNRVVSFCEYHDIDLKRHIELKMYYNDLRPYRNGKEY